MTNPQHEALVEAVARAMAVDLARSGENSSLLWPNDTKAEWSLEDLRDATIDGPVDLVALAIAALSSTAATPSDEVVRLRAALEEIAGGTLIALECGDTWPSPLGAKASQQIARAALEPQGKDV